MPSFKSSLIAAFAVLLASADAHMLLTKPVPFKQVSVDNGPLKDTGADFPCKVPQGYQSAGMNEIPVGVPQPLQFKGSAVHSGGSCQISISEDLEPTKSSKWKVIHSIQGGCPANVQGNLPENANNVLDSGLNFTLPDGLKNGKATLAWTWFNNLGNREMYMQCAPIEITGGKGDDSFFGSLPDMYIANVNNIGDDCFVSVLEGNIQFPNPGDSVSGVGPLVDHTCIKRGSGGPGGAPAPNAGNAGPSGNAASSASPSSASPANNGGVFVQASSSAVSSSAVAAATPVASTGNDSSSSGASSGSPTSSGTCSSDNLGKTLCNGEGFFGTCDIGRKIVWMPVAQGTVCKDGTIAAQKRAVRFSKNHIRRGHHLA